MVKLKHRKSKT